MAAEADFWKAVKMGDRTGVERLLAADPGLATARLDGASAILVATYYHKPEVARCLRPHVTEPDIFESALNGQVDMVELLMRHGADPFMKDHDGKTAADHAQAGGHTALAARLERVPWS